MEISKAFGEVLKNYRKAKNFSQEELALKADLDRTFISLLERGKRNATIETLYKLSYALDVKPYDFIKSLDKHIS